MTSNSNGAGMVETSRLRESNAVVASPIVPQGSDNAQPRPAGEPKVSPETDETAAVRDYWHAAKARYQRGDYVDYGSDDWKALPIEDPRKMAGLVAFAEMWRKYNPEIAEDLNRRLRAPEPLWQRPTLAELNQAHNDMLARNRREPRREAA
ncbi:hypothetical protein OG848_08255 [Streptomyces canus]|uniref:hypothetical protein n=1 Tax=Streptomyces canus TaxID=58343 RepID=UPI0032488F52